MEVEPHDISMTYNNQYSKNQKSVRLGKHFQEVVINYPSNFSTSHIWYHAESSQLILKIVMSPAKNPLLLIPDQYCNLNIAISLWIIIWIWWQTRVATDTLSPAKKLLIPEIYYYAEKFHNERPLKHETIWLSSAHCNAGHVFLSHTLSHLDRSISDVNTYWSVLFEPGATFDMRTQGRRKVRWSANR